MLAGNHAKKLVEILPTDWHFYHDTQMSTTGLMGSVDEASTTLQAMGGAAESQGGQSMSNIFRVRPDAVAVNRALEQVAILEHCRPHDTVDRSPPDPPQDSPVTLDSEQEASWTGKNYLLIKFNLHASSFACLAFVRKILILIIHAKNFVS